ncbi:hypothetical protein FRC12_005931 [Ceratobasidium sp. 428]|nr:hypothetical protein FRC09_005182 [Ceratobasidium sp. 395]KAG8767940.1 hypothetical protein FRC12_005931 [Ceratobasidium sp. 428]
MRFTFTSLAALATATVALAQSAIHTGPSINPDLNVTKNFPGWDAVPASTPSQSATPNVRRYTADLPSPESRARQRPHRRRAAPHRFGTRVRGAPQAVLAPPPRITQKCNIWVESDTQYYGYLSPTFNRFGEYGVFQPTQNGSLEVSISYRPDTPGRIEFLATNGPVASYPYIGGITGFSSKGGDIGPGSPNYAYLGGTAQTPPGSPPVSADNSFSIVTSIPQDYESTIWSFDPETMAINVQWINTDKSAPATYIVYANDNNQALLITGDVDEFQYAYDAPYPEVMLSCVPPSTAPLRR